jgi:hypothetical protein
MIHLLPYGALSRMPLSFVLDQQSCIMQPINVRARRLWQTKKTRLSSQVFGTAHNSRPNCAIPYLK